MQLASRFVLLIEDTNIFAKLNFQALLINNSYPEQHRNEAECKQLKIKMQYHSFKKTPHLSSKYKTLFKGRSSPTRRALYVYSLDALSGIYEL